MAQISADFELGTNGNSVGTGDAGSATAWDTSTGVTSTLTYSNTQAAHGSLSMRAVSASGAARAVAWTTALGTVTDHYGRFYAYFTANPASFSNIFQMLSGGSAAFYCTLNSTGKILLGDQAGTTIATFTNSVTLNTWIRIEYHLIHSATVGQAEVKLFNTKEDSTATETQTTAANKNLLASANEIRYGLRSGQSALTFYYDSVIANATSYPGSAVVDNITVNVDVNF